MRSKKQVNWSIKPSVIALLDDVRNISGVRNGHKPSYSQLVEYAVTKTFKNKREAIRERMREYQQKLIELQDELTAMEEQDTQLEENLKTNGSVKDAL